VFSMQTFYVTVLLLYYRIQTRTQVETSRMNRIMSNRDTVGIQLFRAYIFPRSE